jgi:phospholipid/cholesterol/gamma-HCH transport system permease protein
MTAAASTTAPVPRRRPLLQLAGHRALASVDTVKGLIAFALISVVALIAHRRTARPLIRSLVVAQVAQNGLRLLPLGLVVAAAFGLVVVGQIVALLTRLGATQLIGPLVVMVVIRELAPLITAFLVLGRSGTNTVVQLGTSRALGEVEALETLAIDPIHYLVVPRIIGLATAVLALTVYLIMGTLGFGFVFVFLSDVPLTLETFAGEIAGSLSWFDFLLLGFKTAGFGTIIAVATCYAGLARPLTLAEVAPASTQGVVLGIAGCLLLDAALVALWWLGSTL